MNRAVGALLLVAAALGAAAPARAGAGDDTPPWARPAVNYLHEHGHLDRAQFAAEEPMRRDAFRAVMESAFGGGFERVRGLVTAAEVDAALVRRLGYRDLARRLNGLTSPDGWSPAPGRFFGTEILAHELGLRYNHPAEDDAAERSASQALPQADVAYAVWVALTRPRTSSADVLEAFELGTYDDTQKQVIAFAFGLVGQPYVWAGEWTKRTGDRYSYGAQAQGGFDCSGFAWYVLRRGTDSWRPPGRPYEGWKLDERSSAAMAEATRRKLGYGRLRTGDLVFFVAGGGRDADPSGVYHAGIYIGNGWMVHSSGSRAGVSIGYIGPGSWWHGEIAWGRRIIPRPEQDPESTSR